MTDLKESRHLKALKDKLREMFQLDQADLDFGIYRIMNQKRDEIERFLDKDLLPQVREALQDYQPADLIETQRKLEKAVEGAKAAGIDPEQAPNVRQLRAELADSIDISRLEEEIYSHLSTFFSRYYQGGDFLSLRRYKEGVYALPYEGEEVKLHWANADQYYIKSTEAFRSYAFKVKQASPAEAGATNSARDRRVRFDLVSAGTERDNTKAVAGKERRFVLDQQVPLEMDGDELVIRFHYRPDDEKRKQKDLNAEAVAALLGLPDGAPATIGVSEWDFWQGALSEKSPTDANANRMVLEKHLTDYTARNSFDYFIHKDLGGFLRRELDFFIKNEVMFLDDIESDTAPRVEQYLSKIRVLRKIAHKIIAFLAQLENFQKKLWLKKKFVLETNWLVTLDKVPEELYAEIAANDAQREEWVKLFAIDEIRGDQGGDVAYSVPLTVAFLEANPFLVLDTVFFRQELKENILSSIDNIEEETLGIMVDGENFQALNLLSMRLMDQVKCIYIDPPYNTENDDTFPYKDNYKVSSWMTMMWDRIHASKNILSKDGLFFMQIGDDENSRSKMIIEECFEEFKNTAVVRRGIKNVQAQFDDISRLNVGHDVIHIAAKGKNLRLPHLKHLLDEETKGKWDTFWRGTDRETMRYELFGYKPEKGQWRWEETRAKQAEKNYKEYMEMHSDIKTLDQWYVENIQNNKNLDFVRLSDDGVAQYYVAPQSYRLVSDNWLDIPATGNITDFPHEKSLALLRRIIEWNCNPGDFVCDFFAGSGSTAHAAIRSKDNGAHSYRYVVVEAGKHFDEVLKPRLVRYTYASEYSGKGPMRQDGLSVLKKYIRLESYEDCLDNLSLSRTAGQQQLLDQHDRLREEYMLHYMVDVETEGSLLDTRSFDRPFDYTLSVVRDDERKTVPVDLVETFNYLLGLRVKTRDRKRGVLEIIGLSPEGEMVLVLWRNVDEVDSDALDEWFRKQGYNSRDLEFQTIYINGDNNIENQRQTDETWKVRLIEEHFHKLMFDVEGM